MDKKIKDIITKISKELGVTEFKSTKVVENLFNYLKNSMTKMEFEEYYIQKFGKFQIIKKRYDKFKQNKQNNSKITNKTNENDKSEKQNS